jgi:2-isopropylmalate synthase
VPEGAFNLVSWVKELIGGLGVEVGIDWHGHRDRGLDMANTLAAIQGGATRVHGTALGIGERVGNTPMEQILVNLKLLRTGVPIPVNTPIIGRDCFRTATGVHAAAVIKAKRKGDAWLADRVYSGVPASCVGRAQEIEVGPMSGGSNVIYYLSTREWLTSPEVVQAVLLAAKRSSRILTEDEIREIVHSVEQ